jgi:hypothetical protein
MSALHHATNGAATGRRAVPTNNDAIPNELTRLNQWVCWRWGSRHGKRTKIPINPRNGRIGDVSDRSTWGTFEEAFAFCKQHNLAGIGFVFTPDDPFAGVDLDKCIDLTSGVVAPWAQQIVTEFATYAETSPSGTGIKLFCIGKVPTEKTGTRRPFETGIIEIYHHGRFFAVTGQIRPGAPSAVKNCQSRLSDLWARIRPDRVRRRASRGPPANTPHQTGDDEILLRARLAKNGLKFTRLWNGNSEGFTSQSEADLSLCSILAFWCGPNAEAIDRLFRQSGLMRDKWEREDYRGETIRKAIDACNEFFNWDRKKMIDPRISSNGAAAKRPNQRSLVGGKRAESLPQVQLPGGDVTIISAAEQFGRLLGATGRYYVRGGVPVRFLKSIGDHRLEPIRPAAFCSDIESVAHLVSITRSKDGEAIAPTICSESNARRILESFALKVGLPEIRVLSRCPVLIERDGKLVEIAGYDRQSGILAGGAPTLELSLDGAIALLMNLVADFRFATDGDRARGLAAFITPAMVFGGLLAGRAPIDLGEADTSQAGKGYRNKLTAAIYCANLGTVTQRVGGVGSMQETFDAKLVSGVPFISLDNFRGKQDLPWLESFQTEDNYSARVPYGAPMTIDTRRIIVMLTSNAAETTCDLANRSSCVRILKQPAEYQFKRYAEGELLDHVLANQSRYLGAVFAVIREWHRLGKPELSIVDHDFRRWACVLGCIVDEIFKIGSLLEGHRAAQQRISSRGLTWLREVALAVQRAGQIGQWLRPHRLLEILVAAGLEEPSDVGEKWLVATQTLGRKLSRCFQGNRVVVDSFRIERTETQDSDGREKREYAFFSDSPNAPNTPPNEIADSPNTPNDS